MTTTPGSGSMPSEIHIENGEVFEGKRADKNRVIDLTKAENRQLASCFKTEGHSGPSDWQNGDYRVEGDRLVSL